MSTPQQELQHFVDRHLNVQSSKPLPARLVDIRNAGLNRTGTVQFDTEAWQYTDVRPLVSGLSGATDQPISELLTTEGAIRAALESRNTSLLPSAVIMTDSGAIGIPENLRNSGFTIVSIREGIESGNQVLLQHLDSIATKSDNPFVVVNTALLTDGIFIHAPRHCVSAEVIPVIYVTGAGDSAAPRTLIVADEGSSLTVLEMHVALTAGSAVAPCVSEIIVGPSARCSYTRIVDGPSSLQHVSSVFVRADRSAVFHSFFMSTGGRTVRNEIAPSLIGTGAEVRVAGLTLGAESEHVDTVVSMEHAAPHCESRQLFKGIYTDKSSGAFAGTIIVQEGAQKTNAFQSSKSILLSTDASVYTKPRLKIWADDVKCSHGATVGQIDETALFYLRSRGIPESQARILLVRAFVGEVLGEIENETIRKLVEDIVERRLSTLLGGW